MGNPLRELSLDQLRRRTSLKWRAYPPDVLPLWVAEMDVPLARPIVEALAEAVERGDTGYPVGADYAEAMAGYAKQRWDWELDPERSAIVSDVMNGVVEVLKLVTAAGDTVVVNSPVDTPFYQFVGNLGRNVVESPLTEQHRIDLAHLEETFAAASKVSRRTAYLLCSPHNPTGTVHTRAELTAVLRLAEEYGVRVLVDEIHAPLVHADAQQLPLLTLPGSENAFALLSASKAWNLAGIKAALIVAGGTAAEDLAMLPEEVSHGPSHLGVIAHRAALRDGQPWLDDLLAGLDENRRLLGTLLAEHLPQVRYRMPQGTYLAWLDCRGLGLPVDPAQVFLARGRVALVSGPLFGTGGEGHVRLNLGTSPDILEEAVRRMAGALRG
jgi:cysteine-S-conjugate beta-lyase